MQRDRRRPEMFWNVQKLPLQCCGSAFAGLSLCICIYRNAVVMILLAFPEWLLRIGLALTPLYCRGTCAIVTRRYRSWAQGKHHENLFTIENRCKSSWMDCDGAQRLCSTKQKQCISAVICAELATSRDFHIYIYIYMYIEKCESKAFIRFCPYHSRQYATMIFILSKKSREHTDKTNKVDIIETISRFTNLINCLWKQGSIISKD